MGLPNPFKISLNQELRQNFVRQSCSCHKVRRINRDDKATLKVQILSSSLKTESKLTKMKFKRDKIMGRDKQKEKRNGRAAGNCKNIFAAIQMRMGPPWWSVVKRYCLLIPKRHGFDPGPGDPHMPWGSQAPVTIEPVF